MNFLNERDFGMSKILEYKGYIGSIEFSETDRIFYGKVQGIRSLISYEGSDANELIADFQSAIEDYLQLCESRGTQPEKAYKGTFNIRISPELHRETAILAYEQKESLNSIVEKAIDNYVHANMN